MKTTLDLPDDLYRSVKAKSALEGRPVREVTIELYRQWLATGQPSGDPGTATDRLSEWLAMADAAARRAPTGPTARDHFREDRNRQGRR